MPDLCEHGYLVCEICAEERGFDRGWAVCASMIAEWLAAMKNVQSPTSLSRRVLAGEFRLTVKERNSV